MDQINTSMTIHFSPLLPDMWIWGFAAIGILLLLIGFIQKRSFTLFRFFALVAILITLSNPSLLEEDRKPVADVVAIVIDESHSQNFGQRKKRTQEAFEKIQKQLDGRDDLEIRVIRSNQGQILSEKTELFNVIEPALSDVPSSRRAGVIIISDGQIHDVPSGAKFGHSFGPIHHLVSGNRNDKDRQIVISKAPSYGIVGSDITIQYKIQDTNNIHEGSAILTLKRQNGEPSVFSVETDKELSLTLPLEHAGQNIFELSVNSVSGEITSANNRAALIVNGVRDRLRVLLVSGQPHSGGRTWRDLLTSDPSVDLIHFTILREPNKLDATPQRELSLIAFPFRELFEIKLYEFDLIIFDRYRLNRILPQRYFNNIVDYVKDGGALLEASGPSYAGRDSIFNTALTEILPAFPLGDIIKHPFKPSLTELGKLHPVTSSLLWNGMSAGTTEPQWGSWLRQVNVRKESGETLMTGANESPLLILDRIEEGRVAQITSDHIWLWSRGYENGGPHADLLRRIVHWLMKEPELDERALDITHSDDNLITILSRDLTTEEQSVQMTIPSGEKIEIELTPQKNGVYSTKIQAKELGIYSFQNEFGDTRFITIGNLNPLELQAVKSTDEIMQPLINTSGGTTQWLAENGVPSIRMLSKDRRNFGGNGWIGLKQNREYNIEGLKERPLLPELFLLLALLSLIALSWWREGKSP